MRRVILAVFGLFLAGVTAASILVPSSQSRETRFLPMLGDDVVLHMMAIANAAQLQASAAWDERGSVPITIEDGRRIVDLAAASATAAWCGIDWQRANYQPLMVAERKSAARSQDALAYIAKLHDVAKDMFERDLRATSECSTKRKEEVSRFLVGRWRGDALVIAAIGGGATQQ
ncbi:MAG TPA: hypothetical protein VHM01_11970 [Alphaproteobacteria bacterium]|nr:hypothetical protein [Alphaproteobacteria bacterium]